MFQPHHNIFGLNNLHIPHERVPRDSNDVETLESLRDAFVKHQADYLQWLYRWALDFKTAADCDVNPLDVVGAAKQAVEENLLFGVDARIEELRDSAPPMLASRPGLHGVAG